MTSFKSHFLYDRRKRSGIIFLIAIVLVVIIFTIWYTPEKEYVISQQEKEVIHAFQSQIDSLKRVELVKRVPKIFPFNPNYITDYKGYTLGMTVEEIDRLHHFRKNGKWINSIADFKKITKVPDSILNKISPYFKFPDWVTQPKKRKSKAKTLWKSYDEKGMLNKVSLEKLMAINGMDSLSAIRVIRHIQKIGGYQMDSQIYDVYGVHTNVKKKILNEYTVKEKPTIDYINVNTATASDLSTIPLVNFDLAKEIVDYRILHEGIRSLDELLKLDGMTTYKFDRIKLYLLVE